VYSSVKEAKQVIATDNDAAILHRGENRCGATAEASDRNRPNYHENKTLDNLAAFLAQRDSGKLESEVVTESKSLSLGMKNALNLPLVTPLSSPRPLDW
jgi:hypothetical protein